MAKLAAKVYGEALFGAAADDGKADVLLKEIPMVQKALAENPELSAVMDHPKILKEEKMSSMKYLLASLIYCLKNGKIQISIVEEMPVVGNN